MKVITRGLDEVEVNREGLKREERMISYGKAEIERRKSGSKDGQSNKRGVKATVRKGVLDRRMGQRANKE